MQKCIPRSASGLINPLLPGLPPARVHEKPNSHVYVLDLEPNGVYLMGRCWFNNTTDWMTRCDLLEKTKFRFLDDGIPKTIPSM